MRLALLSLALLLLAGCSSPTSDPSPAPADEAAGAAADLGTVADAFPFTLAEGHTSWYPAQGSGIPMVFHVTGFCTNSGGEAVFDYMFHLSERLDAKNVPAATTALRAQASWTPADYVGDTLRLVARPPGGVYSVLAELQSGVAVDVALEPWEPDSGGWDFWLCTKQATPDADPRARPTPPFLGDIETSLVALG